MYQNSCFRILLFLTFFGISSVNLWGQTDLQISNPYTVEKDSVREYGNITLTSNSSHLHVEGTLIIHGDLVMDANQAKFSMGEKAVVIIYGDFIAHNQVTISVSSYLVIHGSFLRKTGSSGEITINNGNIYIFGAVDGDWTNMKTCDDYQGGSNSGDENTCEYGTEDDFNDNSEDFPEYVKEVFPCLNKNEWTGTADTNWNNPDNWSCNSVPTLQTNVIIPAGLSRYPDKTSGEAALAKDIIIEDGASVVVDNYSLQIAGELLIAGDLDAKKGHLWLVGNSAQTIPDQTFVDNSIKNLTIENLSGVTSEGPLEITGILTAKTGDLKTGNNLTLISDENQTALINGSGEGQVLGTVKMQRHLDNSFGYKYFSSPFQNSTVGDFSDYVDLNADFPNFYRYDENREIENPVSDTINPDATGWQAYTNSDFQLSLLEGYAINFGDKKDLLKVEISGTVNNGSYTRTLYNHNGKYTKGFNLIGNPYPSPINWKATSGWTKMNIDDAIYFFTAGTADPYTGTYTSFVDGVSTDGRSSSIIPSMQGFFVHVSDATADDSPTTATLGMTNEVRVNNFDQKFLKSRERSPHSLIRISAGYENEQKHDPTVVYLTSNASLAFEKDRDAHKLMNTAENVPNFYSITPQGDKLAINAIPKPHFNNNSRIPLGLKTERSGNMRITLNDVQNLSTGAYLYLVDEEKKVVQNLFSDPVYQFQIRKGNNHSRFYLLFSDEKINNPGVFYDEPFSVETANGQVLVKINLEKGEKGPLRISTVTGQIINVLQVAEKEVVEINGIRSSGVYFISYQTGKGTFTKKILVKK